MTLRETSSVLAQTIMALAVICGVIFGGVYALSTAMDNIAINDRAQVLAEIMAE